MVLAFEAQGIEYLIGGSVASSTYGVARSTLDVDLVARLEEGHVQRLVAALEDAYYLDETAIREAIRRRDSFNLIHLGTAFKVDVFVLKQSDYAQAAFSRRQLDTMVEPEDARPFYFASPEDILLHKLYWFRLGGEVSERQWSDVLGVLRVQRDALDGDYLERWADELNITDLLARARAEADTKR